MVKLSKIDEIKKDIITVRVMLTEIKVKLSQAIINEAISNPNVIAANDIANQAHEKIRQLTYPE